MSIASGAYRRFPGYEKAEAPETVDAWCRRITIDGSPSTFRDVNEGLLTLDNISLALKPLLLSLHSTDRRFNQVMGLDQPERELSLHKAVSQAYADAMRIAGAMAEFSEDRERAEVLAIRLAEAADALAGASREVPMILRKWHAENKESVSEWRTFLDFTAGEVDDLGSGPIKRVGNRQRS